MSLVREPGEESLPGYRLIEPLGSGGFGEAWKCEAPGGIFKAIKFVFGNLNSLDNDGARAEQELKALNRVKEIRHPFILSMDLIKIVEGELVIVMELADRSLHDAYQECLSAGLVGIPRSTLLSYVRDAAEALDHMNEKYNLQHLDIKPRNLFLISNRVKVADFGLVKHLERSGLSGVMAGATPLYAPPETLTGKISANSDQYSLAIVYQELLTGQRPFNGKNPRQLAQQHMQEEPDLRSLPEAERPVVARALSKDPAKRFPNCLAFVRALYTARSPGRLNRREDEEKGTIHETMEDILLEQLGSEEEEVDLGAEPKKDGSGSHEQVSELGLTMAFPQTGSLRPTVVVGVGGVGRRALVELRCRLIDRFGDLDKIPLLKFLYVDTDADAIRDAKRGSPEVAFRDTEVYHLALQPVAHYRRRQLDHLNEWLPREKLFSMPRSLKTLGSRALGRLAFSDNYLRAAGKLKKAILEATHPDAVYRSVSETGLALRDNVPRVYVVAGAGGGTSGLLTDLGYTLRRLLQQMHHPEAPLTCLLFCGSPEDPATPRNEQANVYAMLTELNHFADPSVPFSAQYGTDGPRLVHEGPAFDNTYLLTLENRTPEGRRDVLAHLGSYLFHELTTPLGLRLDACRRQRQRAAATPFRGLGTYGVWFPRGLLLRLAARVVCLNLVQQWQALGEPVAPDDPATAYAVEERDATIARILADPDLDADALTKRLAQLASEEMEGEPSDLLTQLLSNLEDQAQQSVAQDDPAAWSRTAVTRVRDWLGGGVRIQNAGSAVIQRKSKLTRALEAAAGRLATEWALRLSEAAHALMEHPGRRIAIAEDMFTRLIGCTDDAIKSHANRLAKQSVRTKKAQDQLENALEACMNGGGFSWFGSRPKRQLRILMDHLAAFSRQCLAEDFMNALYVFYGMLRCRLADGQRELSFCRQRLRHAQEFLESSLNAVEDAPENGDGNELSPGAGALLSTESYWESIRESATTRVVLPAGEEDLEQAASRFVTTLTPEQWLFLDQGFQDQVLALRGGLYQACSSTSDLVRHLVAPLLTQATACLGNYLPVTDVAEFEITLTQDNPGEMAERIRGDHQNAAPLTSAAPVAAGATQGSGERRLSGSRSKEVRREYTFLLVPASDSGKAYSEEALEAVPDLHLVTVPGQADLMFCREQTAVSAEELERILRPCRSAYDEVAHSPPVSPHARFDIHDWTPLDP